MTSKDYLNNENHSTFDRQMGMSGKKFWQDKELKIPTQSKASRYSHKGYRIKRKFDLLTQMQQEINSISNEDFRA